MQRACEVHQLVDGDDSPRDVAYCGICGVFMCADCRRDPVKRGKAMLRKFAHACRT